MSQKEDSESDIWEYKPLEKKKKSQESSSSPDRNVKIKAAESGDFSTVVNIDGHNGLEADNQPSESSPTNDTVQTEDAVEGPSSGDFCPMCQMPFSILLVQTQRWHVAECLDTPRDKCKECPDGLRCFSTIPSHYKKFNHTLLAHSRANSTSVSCLPGLINNDTEGSTLETSQQSVLSDCSSSPHSNPTRTSLSKLKNGFLLLRSPGPDDLKKKKGWSLSSKGQKTISASQESKTELSLTPIKAEGEEQACEGFLKGELSPDSDDAISYSPLSDFPAEKEVNNSECRKALFINKPLENEDEDSLLLSDDFLSGDELLTEFIDNLETNDLPVKDLFSSNTQLEPVTSLAPTNQITASTVSSFGHCQV
uniref:Uncharacterized protein n=1 Tax=Monopterus albus TaxID=43700 RepID=A0A3Q3KFG1_MONAL